MSVLAWVSVAVFVAVYVPIATDVHGAFFSEESGIDRRGAAVHRSRSSCATG